MISQVEALVLEVLSGNEDIFPVEIKIKPTNNIKIFLDADSGLSIEKCSKLNKAVYKLIEERGWFPDGNFSLEVSSPGLDEPLKLFRQYKKNIGRNIEVTLTDNKTEQGKLMAATEDAIQLEQHEGKGKKAIVKTSELKFSTIKQAKIIISF